jgi:hypothetical protein
MLLVELCHDPVSPPVILAYQSTHLVWSGATPPAGRRHLLVSFLELTDFRAYGEHLARAVRASYHGQMQWKRVLSLSDRSASPQVAHFFVHAHLWDDKISVVQRNCVNLDQAVVVTEFGNRVVIDQLEILVEGLFAVLGLDDPSPGCVGQSHVCRYSGTSAPLRLEPSRMAKTAMRMSWTSVIYSC